MDKIILDKDIEVVTLKSLKPGEYFVFIDRNGNPRHTVYVKDGYDRLTKKYEVFKFYDINDSKLVSGDRRVTQSFIF